jgi:hypothetical protein
MSIIQVSSRYHLKLPNDFQKSLNDFQKSLNDLNDFKEGGILANVKPKPPQTQVLECLLVLQIFKLSYSCSTLFISQHSVVNLSSPYVLTWKISITPGPYTALSKHPTRHRPLATAMAHLPKSIHNHLNPPTSNKILISHTLHSSYCSGKKFLNLHGLHSSY